MVLIGVPQIAMNELNNVHKEFDVAWKTRKASHMCLAKHMMMIRDRYMERILNTRFEVTRTKLNSGSFDMEIELDLYDMEIAAPFSFNEDIYEKIGTNECNTIGKSGEDIIEEEQKSSTGRKDREIIKNSWSSKHKVEKWRIYAALPAEEETEEVDTLTTISRASVTALEYTTYPNIH